MKKLKLNKVDFAGAEVLTRNQLKKVMGGDMNETGDGDEYGESPKVAACKDKSEGAACSFLYNGSTSTGYCRSYAPNYVRHCSNLL